MFYSMYLSSLCGRRSWPSPLYEPYRTSHGHFCKVRVNNREYCTDVPYETEALAQENAAMKAYLICRNFSFNDGMYPGQRPGQRSSHGTVQGLPVAIGSGRRSNRSSGSSYDAPYSSSSEGGSSGEDSPRGWGGAFEQHVPPISPQISRSLAPAPRLTSQSRSQLVCCCHRGAVRAYGRCEQCLRESGWS